MDAMFSVPQVIYKCLFRVFLNEHLFMAFVDLRKAYDEVPRE